MILAEPPERGFGGKLIQPRVITRQRAMDLDELFLERLGGGEGRVVRVALASMHGTDSTAKRALAKVQSRRAMPVLSSTPQHHHEIIRETEQAEGSLDSGVDPFHREEQRVLFPARGALEQARAFGVWHALRAATPVLP